MGTLLKEALKCLCGENQWSYAVFWKIGFNNPTLLVWEEYHYEPARHSSLPAISGIESTELLLKEWEGLWNSPESHLPQLGCQTGDKVLLLINKMMINNQVHVVGEGIVGRAAFMGMHQWILQEHCMVEGYPSEVLAEVQLQFSAGMQTVAVIPVLPHGVVQLGSTLAVVENTGFVSDVKSLFAQLGSVPGALLSDTYTREDPGLEIGASSSLEVPISADPSGNLSSQAATFVPLTGAGFNQQNSTYQAAGFGNQPSRSLAAQIHGNLQLQPNSSLTPTSANTFNDLFQIKNPPNVQPNFPFKREPETRETGAQVILASTDARLNKQASPNNSSTRSSHQFIESSSSSSSLTFIGQQILSGAGLPTSINSSKSQLRSSRGMIPTSLKDSIPITLFGGSKSLDTGNDHQTLTSSSCSRSITRGSAESNSPYPPLKGLQLNCSASGMVSASNHQNSSNCSDVLPRVPLMSHPSTNDNHIQTKWNAGKQVIENDLFQALHILSAHPDERISRSTQVPDFFHDHWVSSMELDKGTSGSCNTFSEDAQVKPPLGDDLFEILGLDTKSGKHCGSWKDSLTNGGDANMRNANMDVSKCITQTDACPDFYAMNDGISESGIFSETASDHLLDAVVSKVHSGAKQITDDDVSCWTTLTKTSSSSVPTGSPSGGNVRVLDQKQGKIYGLPPSLLKAQTAGPSSFNSGCMKDNAGETSQISSMYGSQISLVVEDGQNMKCENSISTAQSKRPHETGKANRKRLRPGESPRPRPKDRQMIQDRVKELREIVPNGAKCSIDALLERTIKHMLFLQSVTKHADKLKQTGESKIISKDGGLLSNGNFEGGATWAFEVGSQSMVCPIIVEDLNPPRQMLVEMLCEERGFFLEIADIIRGLGLTILKGVMEARNDKVWVRFTVEANRDVTRMEIFLSLVHLLEQAVKGNTAASKGIAGGKMIAHDTSHQASIPATGQSASLQ
ncbi:Myc-type [Macleaya cordata]|uniref:Myc-type n=1 Tax=Macleaya cordata TaxID=56857 RepID=A0A200Q9M0_MACCD|nr:Myc-type [Macleaya cordata]